VVAEVITKSQAVRAALVLLLSLTLAHKEAQAVLLRPLVDLLFILSHLLAHTTHKDKRWTGNILLI
jgi:hypothetical protein